MIRPRAASVAIRIKPSGAFARKPLPADTAGPGREPGRRRTGPAQTTQMQPGEWIHSLSMTLGIRARDTAKPSQGRIGVGGGGSGAAGPMSAESKRTGRADKG